MKRLLTFLLLLISFFTYRAQQPEGRLYTLTYCINRLGYIEYPGGNYVWFDSLGGTDLLVHQNRLFVAGSRHCLQEQQVYIYDLSQNKLDTVLAVPTAQHLALWEGQLLVTTLEAPFLRAFDLHDLSPVFSILDSSYQFQSATDLKVWEDRAFLLLQDRVAVVDLDLQDTLAVIPTPHPLPFGGINQFGMVSEPHLYVEVEYATGALRSSLMRLHLQSLQLDTVFHAEGYGSWLAPVATEEAIYLYHFDSHYDISADSLYISPRFSQRYPLAFDKQSDSFFLLSGDTLMTWSRGQYGGSTLLPGAVSQGWFDPEGHTSAQGEKIQDLSLQIFPNPTPDRLWVRLPEGKGSPMVRLLNTKGQVLQQHVPAPHSPACELDLSSLSRGGYLVEVEWKGEIMGAQVVKW